MLSHVEQLTVPMAERALVTACAERPLSTHAIELRGARNAPGRPDAAWAVTSSRDARLILLVTVSSLLHSGGGLQYTDVEASLSEADRQCAAGAVIIVPNAAVLSDAATSALMDANAEVVFANRHLAFMLGKALDAVATAATLGHVQRKRMAEQQTAM